MKFASIAIFTLGGIVLVVGLISSVIDGSISEVFSNFGKGRGEMQSFWWLIVSTLCFVIGTILMKNVQKRT